MPRTPRQIELPSGGTIAVLYEDRAILAVDKPPGWILAPDSWTETKRNLRLYGKLTDDEQYQLALRAVALSYVDPFANRRIQIRAPSEAFLRTYSIDFSCP